ncbi:MAG: efflux RND transporter periplasmic adaptor subunit, partial [Thermodesulfobacteriota bacterium]|nr:efflux RND transporter periplasmic adaptor subunit [Thermodesulfobacteriota bacterium]
MPERKTKTIGILFLFFIVFLLGYFVGEMQPVKTEKDSHSIFVKTETNEKQLYTCGMHPHYKQEGPGNCPICGMKLTPVRGTKKKKRGERKIKYWRAPMDPAYISDKPGKSPMGMDLIPVYEDEDKEDGLVTIDPVMVQNIGVRTEVVKKKSLYRVVRTVGRITYDERKIYHIHTKFTGWIDKLYVNFTGQKVRRGEPLIAIYSPDLVSTQQEYLQAMDYYKTLRESGFEEVRKGGESLLDATRRRLELWDIAPSQIKRLEETREIQKNMILYSPSNGVVVKMEAAREGMYVQPGMNLYTIADISRVWVEADIYEYELP